MNIKCVAVWKGLLQYEAFKHIALAILVLALITSCDKDAKDCHNVVMQIDCLGLHEEQIAVQLLWENLFSSQLLTTFKSFQDFNRAICNSEYNRASEWYCKPEIE